VTWALLVDMVIMSVLGAAGWVEAMSPLLMAMTGLLLAIAVVLVERPLW
jgi:hypothetical protein